MDGIERRTRRQFGVSVLGLAAVASMAPLGIATAQDPSEREKAEGEASAFLQGLDAGDLADVYRLHASPTFTTGMPQDRFVEQLGIARIQAGGPAASRVLVGGQPFHQTPTGQQGDFYFIRYRTSFPSGIVVFQDINMEKVGVVWKVAGFWIRPIPAAGAMPR